jgi:predicted nuclease of restriction endonuclease-like RecB superfamily
MRGSGLFAPASAWPRIREALGQKPAAVVAKRGRSNDLARLLTFAGWIAIPEPEPIGVGVRLLFPDIELISPSSPHRWLIERVGFWTPRYLAEKSATYAAAGIDRLILCVDRRLQCADGAVPEGVRVVFDDGQVVAEEICRVLGE